MKALLLAAGLGTRLKPFTFFRAKPALPLLDLPFIHYPLQYLHANGVTDVVINVHAHPETVSSAAGSDFHGMRIHYSHEPAILGTAGAMWKAREALGSEPFAVINSDMLCNIPLEEMLSQHQHFGSLVTLAVMDSVQFPGYSGLNFEEGHPSVFAGLAGPGKKVHYTGVQIVSPEVVDGIPADRKSEIFADVYPSLVSTRRINGFEHRGAWLEIGNLKEYLQTSLSLMDSPLPEPLCPPGMSGSMISREAIVEDGAVVQESIVMPGAIIRSGAIVRRSIVGWDVTVSGEATGVALARGILPWWIQP